jgi:hypothetical protein
VVLASVGLLLQTQGELAYAGDRDPGVILEWNALVQSTAPAASSPIALGRYYSITNVAMFDAANSIARRYTPFRTSVTASPQASVEAAAAQAAHDVLVAMIPGGAAAYDAALAARLASIPPGFRAQGSAVGKAVASRILAWRTNDGIGLPPFAYSLPLIPGMWQPIGGAPVGLTQVPHMLPFTLVSATQFLPPRFPEMTSARYTADFNEVKSVGAASSVTRTAEQTQLAQLFAAVTITGTNIFTLWNNVARDLTLSEHLGLLQSARLFALMSVSQFDGLMTSQTGKFIYGLWRPVTAIQRAAEDHNDATVPDAGWTAFLATPPYPTYPGNMACIGAASARAAALAIGSDGTPKDAVAFTATWRGLTGMPDISREYSSLWQLAQDEADSRIYGGIHFRFDNEASQEWCVKVADQAHAKLMRPLH